MTNTNAQPNLSINDQRTYLGLPVIVIDLDCDPDCYVHIIFKNDPDRDLFVPRAALIS